MSLRRRIVTCLTSAFVLFTAVNWAHAATLAHYRFESLTNDEVIDSVSGTTHGAAIDATLSTDTVIEAIFADGVRNDNDRSLEISGESSVVFSEAPFIFHQGGSGETADATLEFFIKAPEQEHTSIFWTHNSETDDNRYNIYINPSDGSGSNFNLAGDYREDHPSDETGEPHPIGSQVLPADTWVHYAIVRRDLGGGNHEYRHYLNYNIVVCNTVLDLGANPPTATDWTIAGRAGFPAEILIDEIRFSDVALEPGDFLQVTGPPTPDCPSTDCDRFNFQVIEGVLSVDYRERFVAMPDPPHPVSGTVALPVDEWFHMAVVREETGPNEHLYRYYINGVEEEDMRTVDPNPEGPFAAPDLPRKTSWTIGGRDGFPLRGLIDEVRISTAALAPEQFLKADNSGTPLFAPGVVAHYRFEEGSGGDIKNSSGGGAVEGSTSADYSDETPGPNISSLANTKAMDLSTGFVNITERSFIFHHDASGSDANATLEFFLLLAPQDVGENGSIFWTRSSDQTGPSAPVAWYRFEEGSGDQILDSISQTNQGVITKRDESELTGDEWDVDTPTGQVLGLTNDGSLRVDENTQVFFNENGLGRPFGLHARPGFNQSATIEFWLRIVRNQPHGSLFWTRRDGQDQNRFNFSINPGGGIASDYRDAQGGIQGTHGVSIPVDLWTHVAVSREDLGVGNGHKYRWYVDGLETGSTQDDRATPPTETVWSLGGRGGGPIAGEGDLGFGVDILIDELRFHTGVVDPNNFLINNSNAAGAAGGGGGAAGIVEGPNDANRVSLRMNKLTIGMDYRSAPPDHEGPAIGLGCCHEMQEGVWQHVAIVRTDLGPGSGHFIQWYFDGVEDVALATANDPTVLPLPIDDGWGINTRLEFPNHSKIDELRFTNLALTPEEFLRPGGDPNPVPSLDVEAYYRFEDSNDLTLNSNDGDSDGAGPAMASIDNPGEISGEANTQSLQLGGNSWLAFTDQFPLHRTEGDVTVEFFIKPVDEGETAIIWARAGGETPIANPQATAYLRFEEGNGTDIIDSLDGATVGTHNAIYSQDVPFSQIPGTCETNKFSLSLDANGPSFATITERPFSLHDTGDGSDATLEFWLKVPDVGEPGSLFWTRADATDENRYNITINPNVRIGSDYRPSVNSERVQGNLTKCPLSFPANRWVHVAIVRTAVANVHQYNYFIDGAQAPFTASIDGDPDLPTSASWTIGSRGPGGETPVTVLIDEIRMHRGAISSSELLVKSSGSCTAVGACELANGDCQVLEEAECGNQGGTYQGDDSICTEAIGACCVEGVCQGDLTEAACSAQGGTFQAEVNCESITCPVGTVFRRGDCDQSGKLDFNDAIFHLRFLFLGENEETVNACRDACDSDDSGADDFTDDINSLRFLFLGQGDIPSPGPQPDESHPCGTDPTTEDPEELTCESYTPTVACP